MTELVSFSVPHLLYIFLQFSPKLVSLCSKGGDQSLCFCRAVNILLFLSSFTLKLLIQLIQLQEFSKIKLIKGCNSMRSSV